MRRPTFGAVAERRGRSACELCRHHRGAEARERHRVLPHFDARPLAGRGPTHQRRHHRHGCGLRGHEVGVREPDLHRLAIRPADQVVDARRRREIVAPGAIRPVRAFRAECGQGEVDDVGFECSDVLVRDAELTERVFADVRDDDVGRRDQLLEHRATLGAVDLEPDAALLGAREVQRRNGVAAHGLVELGWEPARTTHAQRVGPSCGLHPDDVGTELREVARRHWSGDAVTEFEDAETLEREPRLAAIVHRAARYSPARDDLLGVFDDRRERNPRASRRPAARGRR